MLEYIRNRIQAYRTKKKLRKLWKNMKKIGKSAQKTTAAFQKLSDSLNRWGSENG